MKFHHNPPKVVVLTGAGISAESGIRTFRDSNGLWEDHDIMEVASPGGWRTNAGLVLDFYNKRRRQLQEVVPNAAHFALAELQNRFDVTIITQNVDDLHERAGSKKVIHLHGELLKVRSTRDEHLVLHWPGDLHLGDLCRHGSQLRPHIVWFGEEVPLMRRASSVASLADIFMVVGTSLQVYPAAGLTTYVDVDTLKYHIDPNPGEAMRNTPNLVTYAEAATTGVRKVVDELMKLEF